MARIFKSWASIGLTATVMAIAGSANAQDAGGRDAEFRAAVVYNFARFANWPPTRFADAAAPVVLCVDPSEALLPALTRLEGLPVGARKLHVRTVQTAGAGCHLAYVSASDAAPGQVTALNRLGVLTVGGSPNFSKSGAISLVKVGQQVRFEINTTAARDAGVTLSSQLMRLAILVRQ